MGTTTKIIIGVIVFGFVLPLAIIMSFVSAHDKRATDLAGIRDYNAGRYDAAIPELRSYLKTHPYVERHTAMPEKVDFAQKYLGLALLKQHHYAEAVSVLRVYSQYEPGSGTHYLLGKALFYNGDKAEARAKFKEAVNEELQESLKTRDYHLIDSAEAMIKEIDQTPPRPSQPNAPVPPVSSN